MLTGKAIARAVRAHFKYDAALNYMMLTDVVNVLLPLQHATSNSNGNAEVTTMRPDMSDEVINTPDLDEARVVYEKLEDGLCVLETHAGVMS